MVKRKIMLLGLACVATVFMFTACGNQSSDDAKATPTPIAPGAVSSDANGEEDYFIQTPQPTGEIVPSWGTVGAATTKLDIKADTIITFNGDSISVNGKNAVVCDNKVTITASGSYLISGKLNDGQLIVDTQDEKKVELIFNGVDISCSNSAPIYVVSAPKKVVIELVDASVNLVKDGAEYIIDTSSTDAEDISAAIYSKEDLEITGKGTLYVTGNYEKGIFSKDDLTIEDGNIFVAAKDDGIRGKDSIEMLGGNVRVEAGADGFKSSNDTDAGKGYIAVSGGSVSIIAGDDGMHAETNIKLTGGEITIQASGDAKKEALKYGGSLETEGAVLTISESADTEQ